MVSLWLENKPSAATIPRADNNNPVSARFFPGAGDLALVLDFGDDFTILNFPANLSEL